MYLNVVEVDTAVQNLAAAYPTVTQLITLPYDTVESRSSHALRIGAGTAGSRDVVMAIGGQHAREWGSCEILVGFAADLLEAYTTNAGLAYGGKTFTAAEIQSIGDNLHVVVFPLVNPDGRHYSQTVDANWRRNRNPAYSGGNPSCIGVDLNRNYDILFDYKTKFHPDAYSPMNPDALVISDNPCDANQTYHGPSAFSEFETRNVRWLMDMFPRTRWFFDVHSYLQLVLWNWGDDDLQSTDPAMNFRNSTYDGTRGLKSDALYKEYIPEGDADIEIALGTKMRDTIATVRGKQYTANPSFAGLYPTSGSSQDYAYSRHYVDPSKARTFGYTIEWGTEFQPPWVEMELIVKDISAGLLAFCVEAQCAAGLTAVSLDTPTINFIDIPAGEEAVRAVVFTVQTCGAVTFTAQSPVENPPGAGTFGLPFGGIESLPAVPNAAPREVRVWIAFQAQSPNAVLNGSVTIHCDPLDQDFVVSLTANTVSPPTVAAVLVLDKSGSMSLPSGIPSKQRMDVLHDAAPVFIDLLADNHGVGVVAFDHDPTPLMPVTAVGGGGRAQAYAHIANHQTNPNGLTAIGDGVEAAHNYLVGAPFERLATVVFTDGHETAAKYIADVQSLISERVFAIGLGTAQELNPVALNQLVNDTDGYLLLTGDLTGDDAIRVEKYFSQVKAGVSNEEIVVDPEGFILPGPPHRIPFLITETDQSGSAFLISPAPWAIDFTLETPTGDVIDPVLAAPLPGASFETGPRVHLYRLAFPVPVGAGAKQGTWNAVVCMRRENYKKWLSDDRQPGLTAEAVHGLRYSVNVHTSSYLRMTAAVVQRSHIPGAELGLQAVLTEAGVPVERRAVVRADVTPPSGSRFSVGLSETAAGVFEASVPTSAAGVWEVRYRASGTTLRGFPFTREQLRTGAVWRGGDHDPPSSKAPDNRGADWSALLDCLLQQRSFWAWLKRNDIDPDELRRCLHTATR